MAEAIRMPLLSDTMKEGKIVAWHKKTGDTVKSDDVIAEVETDKATMEVLPYVDGTLLYIGIEAGQSAKINDIIAIVGKQGEDFQSILNEDKKATGNTATAAPAQQDAGTQPKENDKKQTTSEAPAAEKQPEVAKSTAPLSGDATVVRMPLLSDTMKEGKIVAWHKKVGDSVKSDDTLADVETDKATMEVMPYVDGTLLYVGLKEGEAAKVNDIIAIVGKAGTDINPYLQQDKTQPTRSGQTPEQQPAATNTAAEKEQASTMASTPHDKTQQTTEQDERLKASPLAKKLAEDKGINLSGVHGSGDNGRIIKRDIDNYKAAPGQQQPAKQQQGNVPQIASLTPGKEEYVDLPNSQMRNIIAKRLAESKFSAPHFYLRITVTMDTAIEARKSINEISPVKVSFNDLLIKACAMALRKHPQVNSSWMGDFIRQHQHIHIGTAVAVEDGLIVPVIKFADQKSLSQIAQEAGMLIDKARNKKIQPQEFTGNTFTISNLGMMDIDEFTAIINPPDACILAIGKIEATPVVADGEIVIRNLMKLTLSCDHRVVDGAVGSRFLQTLKAHLENPVTMLV
ncbi:MAG: pyruvate dehydrogenase complex dihydrolipoamide acetyltransferase [Taibaiella sp.]|nr:pyruvate dehydrogenase complex dihydrolipoamide acetyltransferase [Taibaiella sp.]